MYLMYFNYKEELFINSRSSSGSTDWLGSNKMVSNTNPLHCQ